MTVTIERVDFTRVEPQHLAIDARLVNWARYVKDWERHGWRSIWRLGKPMGRHAEQETPRTVVDGLDALAIEERAVAQLPEMHRAAIRWCYVYQGSPARQARALGVRYDTLARLVVDARRMLIESGLKRSVSIYHHLCGAPA